MTEILPRVPSSADRSIVFVLIILIFFTVFSVCDATVSDCERSVNGFFQLSLNMVLFQHLGAIFARFLPACQPLFSLFSPFFSRQIALNSKHHSCHVWIYDLRFTIYEVVGGRFGRLYRLRLLWTMGWMGMGRGRRHLAAKYGNLFHKCFRFNNLTLLQAGYAPPRLDPCHPGNPW